LELFHEIIVLSLFEFVRVSGSRNFGIDFGTSKLIHYFFAMSTATAKLLSGVEALAVEEKEEFWRDGINHLPPWDSGHLAMTSLLPPVVL